MSVRALELVRRGLSREVVVSRRAVAAIGVGAVVACLTLGAYARVPLPFTPVPITVQTLFVLVAGAALGRRLGTVSTSLYVLLGAVGLPVFTTPWLGATAGYLLGFVPAAWVVGVLTSGRRGASTRRLVLAMVAGTLIVYLFGAGWLAFGLGLGAERAAAIGIAPFLVGDGLKLAAAVAFIRSYQPRLRALFPRSG